ncbi:FAD-dependent pyridine nucleotide-disulfide oxidoreductase [Penicillium bovifimosum]|uniref:FAD-dependent pyridine nucleotide-disulfide oxidoreductase n=1 Tax=Penicillium bovifimosum TaxID=126998 RepID=A0A9W9H0T0_9EURO|nr:FAD-dependent pyridine nucleotide-disulfide oxidoreductase [Penicillium bovifimosum]KAJ5135313.1 FAD-dependent pyridine nucleotide-disulfide oxidoreductase [Penicillium bovifimosum]
MPPKKVAIIGAGPSGLVTAKTLLHIFPRGTFSPIIFDTQRGVGGLWRTSPNRADDPRVTLDPRMRTNLSRFTVAFSDLDWESVIPDAEVPTFPRAEQVAAYLDAYAQRYIPVEVLRFGCKVVGTVRRIEGDDVKWGVRWIRERESVQEMQSGDGALHEEESEDFDMVVVASGYFAQKYTPDIPGLGEFPGPVIHSSSLCHERENLLPVQDRDVTARIVVIGGSMSGVEAATAVALHQSSSILSTNRIPSAKDIKVDHIHSRPFWALPTYLPHESSGTPAFIPLDLAMYDLCRRPAGPIEYALGPIPPEKATKTNSYFHSILGDEYEQHAHRYSPSLSSAKQPWVAIGDDYAEFIRSGMIQTSMGRVTSVHSNRDTGLASVLCDGSDGCKTIDNVAAIVMATGFTPYRSLSFLPDEVLDTLEYSETDPFSPLILDQGCTVRSEIVDLGFVGFYRGPYWGVMEMQARYLGKLWSGPCAVSETKQKQALREVRLADPNLARGQFPMGDYVGLMESFADDLGITRLSLDADARYGPAVPARYVYGGVHSPGGQGSLLAKNDAVGRTLDALRDALTAGHETAQQGAASAVFRALHGSWKQISSAGGEESTGTLSFHPRYATSPAYDREYVCVQTSAGEQRQEKVRFIMRLAETVSETASAWITIWSSGLTGTLSAGRVTQSWELGPLRHEMREGESVLGEYVVSAKAFDLDSGHEVLYTFHFQGVSVLSWTCVELEGETRTVASCSFVREDTHLDMDGP